MGVLYTLSVALALTHIPLSLAREHIHSFHRRQSIPSTLPGTWTSQGCVTDNVGGMRTLQGAATAGSTNTIESCITFCDGQGFIYAGVEYGTECYCGHTLSSGFTSAPLTDCNMACSGNAQEWCGAGNRLNLFWSGQTPPPPPSVLPSVGDWVSLGCYSDNVNGAGRTLPFGASVTGQLTIESCTTACFNAGYQFAGAEYASECYCGDVLPNSDVPSPAGDCDMVCAGDSSEFCGGPNRLNVYNHTGTGSPLPNDDTPPAPVLNIPALIALPSGWAYNACWVDNAHGKALNFELPGSQTNTVATCIAGCIANNYTIAGMEYSEECYCGNTVLNGATVAGDESSCNMGCAGDATEACGGPNRLSVYSHGAITALPVPTAMTTDLPGSWTYAGCLREPSTTKMFPYETVWMGNNSATACMNQCAAFGFTAAGVEYGQECYCGDVSDVAANNGVFGSEDECATPCPGDPVHLCGAGNRLNTYYWDGVMNTWHTPTNIGRYEFFVPGLIVPLMATVGINNKVTFLEKGETGPPNATGAYELDLSLSNDFAHMWREMHIVTDVFCAASIILPDKAGRQINVGGWSLESTFGLRFYTPSGSDGVNGTTDWEENVHALALQRGRWYPTAAVLANGTIVVIGGQTGSNSSPQPNLEILPKPAGGDTVIELDWLARTDPFNLYPFVTVLPSSNLFIAYYNEARILDPVTFNTIQQLPNMPGAVNNFQAGRTYPLEGSMIPFPQHAPYTDPLQILICGGSTPGGGYALDNCVSIAPEVPNPTWTLERMPSRRVMPCMVALPDGTTMIMNGAQHGVASFGLGMDPNLNAILYDPTQPVGSRFSILNSTIVARMYHSEATLLPDGRILVSGSDPQTYNPDGSYAYPEEYRIEVYIPPYLNQGFTQPTFTISNTDWSYGQTYEITNVLLPQGTTAGMRISLVAATSSTHGNTMGARTLFPAFSCAGTTCTITAPPNAGVSPPGWHQLFILDGPTPSHSSWVRIGGDPSQLGNWPNLPGFTLPGL